MSKTTKIVLSVVGAFILLGAVTVFAIVRFSGRFIAGPDQAAEIGQEITLHTLPPGYDPVFGMDILGLTMMMAANPNDDNKVLMLVETPDTDFAGAEAEAQDAFQQQSGFGNNYEYTGSREVAIAGEGRTVDTLIGRDRGTDMRQDIVVFPASSGNAAVAIMVGPADDFDEAAFEEFLVSMK